MGTKGKTRIGVDSTVKTDTEGTNEVANRIGKGLLQTVLRGPNFPVNGDVLNVKKGEDLPVNALFVPGIYTVG